MSCSIWQKLSLNFVLMLKCINSQANRKYLKSYDPKQESRHIIYLDANNLNEYAMPKFLSITEFKLINPKDFHWSKYDKNSWECCVDPYQFFNKKSMFHYGPSDWKLNLEFEFPEDGPNILSNISNILQIYLIAIPKTGLYVIIYLWMNHTMK